MPWRIFDPNEAQGAFGAFVRKDHGPRPAAPIVAASPDPLANRIANLLWGVIPVTIDPADLKRPRSMAKRVCKALSLAEKGQVILMVKGFSSEPGKNTPSVTVITL